MITEMAVSTLPGVWLIMEMPVHCSPNWLPHNMYTQKNYTGSRQIPVDLKSNVLKYNLRICVNPGGTFGLSCCPVQEHEYIGSISQNLGSVLLPVTVQIPVKLLHSTEWNNNIWIYTIALKPLYCIFEKKNTFFILKGVPHSIARLSTKCLDRLPTIFI